jgi:hypothetical protein
MTGAIAPALFALAMFLGAGLSFALQPMVARMILPKFGGTPAVWNVSLLFFQTGLLAGYAYAHALATWLSPRRQFVVHLAVLALAALVLPVAIADDYVPSPDEPVSSLLGLLAITAGLPYFALAATAPLFQRWFTYSGHRHAADPYFLYAASNAGSLIGLLAYPILIEPNLDLSDQSSGWAMTYGAFALCAALCVALAWRPARRDRAVGRGRPEGGVNATMEVDRAGRHPVEFAAGRHRRNHA